MTISSYANNSLSSICGFGYINNINATFYYILGIGNGKIVVFDEYWNYLRFIQLGGSENMITIKNVLYITGNNYILNTDAYLNVIKQYNATGYNLYGIYYNTTSNKIYVSSTANNTILIFSTDLILLDFFNISTYSPTILQGFNNQLFVGTSSTGRILVIVNKSVINIVYLGFNSYITSIIFDDYGYMTVGYYGYTFLNLYFPNMSYTGMRIQSFLHPTDLKFDSLNRLVVITQSQIYVLNS